MFLTLACTFLACTSPLPSAPAEATPLLLAQPSGDITVTYECGNMFLFRNYSLDTLTLTWRVRGNHEEGTVFLPARPDGGPYSETRVTTQVRGPLQVFKAGRVLKTVPNDHGPDCTVAPDSVPPVAPDSLPAALIDSLYDSANLARDAAGIAPFPQNAILVRFDENATYAQKVAAISAIRGRVVGGIGIAEDGYYLVMFPGDGTVAKVISTIRTVESFEGVSHALTLAPEEFHYLKPIDGVGWRSWSTSPALASGDNWAMEAISLPLAWGCTKGEGAASVGLLDTGIEDIPELRANVDPAFHGELGRLPTTSRHGTKTLSLLAARGNDSTGMVGAMWNASVRPVEVIQNARSGGRNLPGSVARGLRRLIDADTRVINLSAGINWGRTNLGLPRDSIIQANWGKSLGEELKRGASRGRRPLLILSAGNDGVDAWWGGPPALKDSFRSQIVTVGAIDSTGSLWSGSNRGAYVDLLAPGVGVYTNQGNGQGIAPSSGTSFSAPLVTGIAGLILSIDPSIDAPTLRGLLIAGATASGRSSGGIPIADAYQSLKLVSRRAGTLLCGNRIWAEGGSVWTERGATTERLFDLTAGSTWWIWAFHGGRTIGAADNVLGLLHRYDLTAQGFWVSNGIARGAYDTAAGSGVSALGVSHDRDTTLSVTGDAVRVRPRSGTSKVLGLFAPSNTSPSGTGCLKWVRVSSDVAYQCEPGSEVPTGSSQEARWMREAVPAGPSGILVVLNSTAGSYGVGAQKYSCFDIDQPWQDSDNCYRLFPTSSMTSGTATVYRLDWAGGIPVPLTTLPGRTVISLTSSEDGKGFAVFSATLQNLTGPTGCGTQFYDITGPSSAAPSGAFHPYGSTCDSYGEQGGFGPTRQYQANAIGPSNRGFALQARLIRTIGE